MRKTHIPAIPEYTGRPPEKTTMTDAVNYMNAVVEKYGPPCNVFCKHFSEVLTECEKGHRVRKYYMEHGPYETWFCRRKCNDIEPPDDIENEFAKTQDLKINMALDCFYQKYCRH